MKRYKKRGSGVLKRCPKTHQLVDVAHDLTQARMIVKAYPKHYNPKIVSTPRYKIYPYHIACLKRAR
jgi:hypothetical protein